jgi:hypothetical protein
MLHTIIAATKDNDRPAACVDALLSGVPATVSGSVGPCRLAAKRLAVTGWIPEPDRRSRVTSARLGRAGRSR